MIPNPSKHYKAKNSRVIYRVWCGEELNPDKIMLINCFNNEEVLVSLNMFNNEFVEYDIAI